jgi:hypothetical protein
MFMSGDVVIWRNCKIGEPDAETDQKLLSECYVDNGSLELILDTENHASIVVGRTGAGKSAILIRLSQVESNVIQILPLDLAFRYVENSTIIKFFQEAGVNLDLFYRLLWRHALITELIKCKYRLPDENSSKRWFDSLWVRFNKDSPKGRALTYLRSWGDKFWLDTETRMREVAKKIEDKLELSIKGTGLAASLGAGASSKLSDEERAEVITRGSAVVNQIQIRELSSILDLLAEEVFNDHQQKYFISIDNLDEDWVQDLTKCKLIRALIEEIRTFRKIPSVKIIISLREDLLERVYAVTRDGGFQEEKYESYYAQIKWNRVDLKSLIGKRINQVFKKKYTKQEVTFTDVLPKDRQGEDALSYILERTFMRPRDVISYVNNCLSEAEGRPRISWAVLQKSGEEKYSRGRLRSLYDEWLHTYPSLKGCCEILNGMPETFTRSSLSDKELSEAAIKVASVDGKDELVNISIELTRPESRRSLADFRSRLLWLLYHVGVIGVKMTSESPYSWSYLGGERFSPGDMKRAQKFRVHKMFWKSLRVSTRLSLEKI